MSSLKSFLGKANGFILKWFGLFGIPFYLFFAKAAVSAKDLNPDADIWDVASEFYGLVADAAVNSFVPGACIVLSEIFNFAADTVAPGAGRVLSAVFQVVAASHAGDVQMSADNAFDLAYV